MSSGEPTTGDPLGRSAGTALRLAREAQGRSVRAVAASLNLSASVIESLEGDDDRGLPPQTYVRGYLRGYARLLDLDAEAIVAAYDARRPAAAEQPPLAAESPAPSRAAAAPELPPSRVEAEEASGSSPALSAPVARRLAVGGAAVLFVAVVVVLGGRFVGIDQLLERADRGAVEPTERVMEADDQSAADRVTDAEQAQTQRAGEEIAAATDRAALDAGDAADASATTSADDEALSVDDEVEPADDPADGSAADVDNGVQQPALIVQVGEGETWLELYVDGERRVSRIVEGPERIEVDAAERYRLVIGNAPVVELLHRGARVDLAPYTRNRVARIVLTDSE